LFISKDSFLLYYFQYMCSEQGRISQLNVKEEHVLYICLFFSFFLNITHKTCT